MKRSKFKINVGFKKLSALFLTITMFVFQVNLMSFASNITGITGNNGIYNIDPAKTSGATGYRQYTNFILDNGHTANLIFNGINRFINAVDNQVTINGILNSVNGSGGFANGRAIFVSPQGFVVGASGVVNVGSLGVYTPSTSTYNTFKNLSVDRMTDALLNSDDYYGYGAITVDGMLLTRETIDLKGSTVSLSSNSKIASGIANKNANTMLSQDSIVKATSVTNAKNNAIVLFDKLVNCGKANFASDEFNFADNNGKITIAAKKSVGLEGEIVSNGDVVVDFDFIGVRGTPTNITGDTYSNGNYLLDVSNHRGTLAFTGNVNAKNISITAKTATSQDGGGNRLLIAETAKLSAENRIDIDFYGRHFINLGELEVINSNGFNVDNAGIYIDITGHKKTGTEQCSYVAGTLKVINGNVEINKNTDLDEDLGGYMMLAFAKGGKIYIENGDLSVTQNANSLLLFENEINIQGEGDVNIVSNARNDYFINLQGDISTANGDVNIVRANVDAENNANDAYILNLGNINATGNVNIKNETSGGIVLAGNISSKNNGSSSYNGVVVSTSEQLSSRSVSILGSVMSDKNIIITDNSIDNNLGAPNNRLFDAFAQHAVYRKDDNMISCGDRIIPESEFGLSYEEAYNLKLDFFKNEYLKIGDMSDLPSDLTVDDFYSESVIYGFDNNNTQDLYIGKKASLISNGSDGSIILIKNGQNGGINQNGVIESQNDVKIVNAGERGIMLNEQMNVKNKTYIEDNSIADINARLINTGSLEIQNNNRGNININFGDSINSNGNVLVQNNTSGKIDISGTLNNSSTSGTTKIVNESSNTGGINISGKVGAKNATTITNKGNSLINITGDVVDSVVGITVEQTNTGANGGISITKGITTDGYLTIDNKGQKGITLVDGANTTSQGKTTIKDTSNAAINIQNGSKIEAGSLLVDKSGKGGINLAGSVNSAADTLVVNSGTDSINISNTFAGGKTTIYNDVNGKDINISGAVTTNGETMIVQGGSGILNITNTLKNNSQNNTIISNVNGSGLNVANITTNGFTLLENSGKGNITINGNINANNGDLSIQNQNYQIAINKTNNNNSNLVSLARKDADSTNKDGGIVAKGNLSGNKVYVQNSGANGITTSGDITAAKTAMITTDKGSINLKSGTVTGGNVVVSASKNAVGGIEVNNVTSQGVLLLENASKGDIVINGNLNGNDGFVLVENQTYDIVTPRASFNNDYIVLDVNRMNQDALNKDGGIVANGSILGGAVYLQNSGSKGISTSNDIVAYDVMITNNAGSVNLNNGTIFGDSVIISNSNKANALNVNADVEAISLALVENAGSGDINIGRDVSGSLVSIQNQTYDIETPRIADGSFITLDVNRIDKNSLNSNGGITTSGNITGGEVYIQNSGTNGITTSGDIQGTSNVTVTNNSGNINLSGGTINSSNVIVSNSNKANELKVGANIQSNNGIVLLENAGSGNMTVNGNINGNSIVLLENQTYDIITPRISNSGLIMLDVNRIDSQSANTNSGLIANGDISGNIVYIQNSGANGITTNSNITSQGDVMITNNSGNMILGEGNILGENVIVSNSNQAGALTSNSNINALNLALIENAGNGNMTVNGNVSGALVSLQNQTYDISTPRVVTQSNGLITLGVNRSDSDSANKGNALVTNGTLTGQDVYIQNSGNGGIKSNSDIQAQYDVMITNNGGSINLESGNISGTNATVSNSNQANGGIIVGANVNTERDGKLVVENAAPGSITLNGDLNSNGGYIIIENQTYDIETPRVVYGDFILLDVNRINQPSQYIDGGIIANGTINGGDVFIQNAGSQGITINNDIVSDNLMVTNDNGGINIGNVNITAQHRDIIISNSSNATSGINIAANVEANSGDVVVENSGNGNIVLTETSSLTGQRVLVENQTYDIETPRVPEGNYILLGVERNENASPNLDGGIIANGNINAVNDIYIQNSGDNGITTNGNVTGQDLAITNNGGSINLNNGTISGDKVIVSQSNQGEGGVTIGSNVIGNDLVLIENAGSADIIISGNIDGTKVSIQNQTYDIETPRIKHNDGLITLDVTRIDTDASNRDGGIVIDGDVTGTEDIKIQNSGDDGITTNGNITGQDVAITNNGGDVNINGDVDGDDVTISNSDNGGDVNINGNVDGNDVLVENNGSGNINNSGNVNGDIKDHEYGIETPRNTNDAPYITLDVKRRPFPPVPTPETNNDIVLRDNDPTRLIYDREQDNNFLELKRESIRYGINGDSLSLNSASNHIQSIVDISKTGLAVKTDGGLKINDEVKVSFAYKGIEVEATAKVMRVNQSTNIAGLKFTDLDNLTANKILYLSMLNEAQREQTAKNNQNQQPSFMNVLSKL